MADTEPHQRKFKLVGGFLLPSICFSNILSAALNGICNHFGVEILYTAEVWACRIWLLSQSGYDTLNKIFALTVFWVFSCSLYMMIALLEDDSWRFKAELSLKRSDCIHMYRKRTDFLHLKRKSQCGEKKEEGNTTLLSKEKEHIIVTGQFQDLPHV